MRVSHFRNRNETRHEGDGCQLFGRMLATIFQMARKCRPSVEIFWRKISSYFLFRSPHSIFFSPSVSLSFWLIKSMSWYLSQFKRREIGWDLSLNCGGGKWIIRLTWNSEFLFFSFSMWVTMWTTVVRMSTDSAVWHNRRWWNFYPKIPSTVRKESNGGKTRRPLVFTIIVMVMIIRQDDCYFNF